MVTTSLKDQQHLFDIGRPWDGTLKTAALAVIERLEAWIEGERIKINNAHNNIQRECAKNTADNYRYLVDLLTNAVERSK